MGKETVPVFVNHENKDLCAIMHRIDQEMVQIRIITANNTIFAETTIQSNVGVVEKICIHQTHDMKNFVVEMRGNYLIAACLLSKKDAAMLCEPIIVPMDNIVTWRVTDKFCACMAKRKGKEGSKFALLIVNFELKRSMRPVCSIANSTPQIAFGSNSEAGNRFYFLETHTGSYYLSWAPPLGDWETEKKSIKLPSLTVKGEKIKFLNTYKERVILVTQSLNSVVSGGLSICVFHHLDNDVDPILIRKVDTKFCKRITWSLEHPGVFYTQESLPETGTIYKWLDLTKNVRHNDFDGQLVSKDPVQAISFYFNDRNTLGVLTYHIDKRNLRLRCSVWDKATTRASTQDTNIKIMVDTGGYDLPVLYPYERTIFANCEETDVKIFSV